MATRLIDLKERVGQNRCNPDNVPETFPLALAVLNVASYQTILVGTDGSATSFRAVAKAAALAADADATLVIVSAYQELSDRDRRRAANELGDDAYKVVGSNPAENILVEATGVARRAGATKVETLAKAGDPVDMLAAAVIETKADLCVVGNRGLNSLAGRILGSVPANISHRAASDVLIVHTTGKGAG